MQFDSGTYDPASVVIVLGGTLPSGYVSAGYLTKSAAQELFTQSGMNGKKWGVFGDSCTGRASLLSTWQTAVTQRTGMTQVFQDGISGRAYGVATADPNTGTAGAIHGIFSHYGGGNGSGACDTSGISNAQEITFGCTAGNTLAQTVAGLDVLLVVLGPNDAGALASGALTLGNFGDTLTSVTQYGYVQNALTVLSSANPTMRLLVVGNPYTSNGGRADNLLIDTCLETQCAALGIPFLSMYKKYGLNEQTLTSMTQDSVHWTIAAYAERYGPMVVDFILANC
ncbi:SGNH/GDSL hydrolase family protein [Granulicella tundricola]|uniref:SGNH hydrolase-type esterase domain-containing protein n=1 Tax=Granulicella tundricola (strain ATCC BAA-1859 / DSM 23138 / MP5ACTX9) TaxID=1198114 RepID=E8X1A8_GRATM|nr:SGNH/GDSL hydrolase family protein [Granulicella tundricola]ADW69062.1 hypothetical protein AciX9_2017 [Granulicella tundricola MP5ACTX9]